MNCKDTLVNIYLRDIGEANQLTREEEAELAKRVRSGDEEARQVLVQRNLRLVVKIAHDYSRFGVPLPDLISEGNIGLISAVERFDPRKGGKLSTYAAWWIKQAIRRALANQGRTIKVPSHIIARITRMNRAKHALLKELGREPTDQELAENMGVRLSTVKNWKRAALAPTSLNAPIASEAGDEVGKLIADERVKTPDEACHDSQWAEQLGKLMKDLDPREYEVLTYRFGMNHDDPETLEQVGRRFDITRERVRQIQKTAVGKLRRQLSSLN